MARTVFYKYDYWQVRAEEACAVADRINNPATKLLMLRIARSYERLARHAREQSDLMDQSGPQACDGVSDLTAKRLLLELAETYEKVAKNSSSG